MSGKSTDGALIRAPAQDEDVQKEFRRLRRLFAKAPERQRKLAEKEIARAAFLVVMIERLERDITENGYEEYYQNGENQKGKKKSAAAELHVSYTKNYLAVMGRLHTMLSDSAGNAGDEFDSF